MNVKAVAGTLIGAGVAGTAAYALMSAKSEHAMTAQLTGMHKAQDDAQAWISDFNEAVPDRSLDTPAEHRTLARYLDSHPAPSPVEVIHDDVDTARVQWNGTWPAKESGSGVMVLGILGGAFTAVGGAMAMAFPKARIPAAIVGAAGIGVVAGTVAGDIHAEKRLGYLSGDEVIDSIK